MSDKEIISLIECTLEKKFEQNSNIIKYTFYELRLDLNLTEDETIHFLKLLSIKLKNLGYKIYYTGDSYLFNEKNMIVGDNELLLAIK